MICGSKRHLAFYCPFCFYTLSSFKSLLLSEFFGYALTEDSKKIKLNQDYADK